MSDTAAPSPADVILTVEPATAAAIAPFGRLVGAHPDQPVFARWPGTTVFGPIPLAVETQGELLVVSAAAKTFPHRLTLIERHFLHTQTYLPLDGRPFAMVLGVETEGDLPVLSALRAFAFPAGSGVVLHRDVWHDFPYALQDDTRFAVILSALAHVDVLETRADPLDAEGPDVQRRALRGEPVVEVRL